MTAPWARRGKGWLVRQLLRRAEKRLCFRSAEKDGSVEAISRLGLSTLVSENTDTLPEHAIENYEERDRGRGRERDKETATERQTQRQRQRGEEV